MIGYPTHDGLIVMGGKVDVRPTLVFFVINFPSHSNLIPTHPAVTILLLA